MATHARQQYFADESSLSKEKREFSIADEIQEKIDSVEEGAQVNKIETVKVNGTALVPDANKAVNVDVPEVIDNLYTVAADDALSAKQGKLLYDYIQNLQTIGRFLSNWDSATGLPITNPSESPYLYKAGDYYRVSNVAVSPALNYKPNGSSFIIGQASTTVETNNVNISDLYLYDGTTWILLSNSGSSIAVDSSLSTTSTNPVENRVITNALNGKQETLVAGSNIQIAADGKTISATDTTYSAGANISIDANNEISAVDTTYTAGTNVQISNQNVISATDTKYTAGTGINIDANNEISNTLPGPTIAATAPTGTEGALWYDTTNDVLMAYNGTAWKEAGTQMEILSYGHSTWQDFIDVYNENAVVYCRASSNSDPSTGSQTRMAFMAYVNNASNPTEVEFQYYRSRSSHSTAANVLDEVYVYKLVSTGGGTWTVTQRDTAAKPIAGTGIGLTYNASGMTIANTGVTSVNGNTGAVTVEEVPSGGTEGQVLTQTSNGPAWQNATGGAEIEYVTQAEYNALLPGALTDNKHYFIYTENTPGIINYTITGSTTVGSFTPGSFSDLQGFYMSPDGENAYITFWNSGNGRMAQYSLSTPWDISTASQTQYISVTKPNGFYFSNNGTYMFLSTEDGNNIVRYSLSTPWDISTASQDSGQVLNVDSSRFADNVCLSDDGDYIWFGVDYQYKIVQYELTTPFDLTTATNKKELSVTEAGIGVMVKNEGKYMYTALYGPVKQYELATPYDITSTATEIGSYSVTVGEHRCLFVSNDCKYWAIGNNSGGITQFEAQPIS